MMMDSTWPIENWSKVDKWSKIGRTGFTKSQKGSKTAYGKTSIFRVFGCQNARGGGSLHAHVGTTIFLNQGLIRYRFFGLFGPKKVYQYTIFEKRGVFSVVLLKGVAKKVDFVQCLHSIFRFYAVFGLRRITASLRARLGFNLDWDFVKEN